MRSVPGTASILCALWLFAANAEAQRIIAGPYLQDATPTGVWIVWETNRGSESTVDWATSPTLLHTASGQVYPSKRWRRLHEVQLAGLSPNTRYFYRVRTGAGASRVFDFRTPPALGAKLSFRFLAFSDTQRDVGHGDVLDRVVQQGILRFAQTEYGQNAAEAFTALLVPGDIVIRGNRYRTYRRHFFAPLAPLLQHVPIFPVIGNHEEDSDYYFRYFHLPVSGTESKPEHWWWRDVVNVRLIGLDSNVKYRTPEQLDWLSRVLDDACNAQHVDFVFAELHHPEHSEIWPRGGSAFSGLIARKLEAFSSRCGKPTLQLSGHTHAYSRGHSRDHRHTMVGVASAAGNLDHLDPATSVDLPEHAVAQDEYGFVVVEVTSGDEPAFRVRRISLGNLERPRDNEERDSLVVRRQNRSPSVPIPRWPRGPDVNPLCGEFDEGPFVDPDGDAQSATHLQLASADCNFSALVREVWDQSHAVPADRDLMRKDAADFVGWRKLEPGRTYCYRVRLRDEGLMWSAWSEPVKFTITSSRPAHACLLRPKRPQDDRASRENHERLDAL